MAFYKETTHSNYAPMQALAPETKCLIPKSSGIPSMGSLARHH